MDLKVQEELEVSKGAVYEKSFTFALRIVKLYKYLCEEKREYVLSKQLLRSQYFSVKL